jgi:hypothetical protein
MKVLIHLVLYNELILLTGMITISLFCTYSINIVNIFW